MHTLPKDFKQVLFQTQKTQTVWQSLTPLAKNEWICWITSGKLSETRKIRIKNAISKLSGGMRRPCCWSGCPHR